MKMTLYDLLPKNSYPQPNQEKNTGQTLFEGYSTKYLITTQNYQSHQEKEMSKKLSEP